MNRFRYATKNELAPIRDELSAIITETQVAILPSYVTT